MQHRLENAKVSLCFEQRGPGLALKSIRRLPDGREISLEPWSADWRLNLKTLKHPGAELTLALSKQTDARTEGGDGLLQAGGHVFEAHWSEQEDRAATPSSDAEGTIRRRDVQAGREAIVASWEGDARIHDESCRFEVTTRWTLGADDFAARTSIEVRLLPAEGRAQTGIYLSSVDYPIYRIQPLGERDHLAAPWIGGHIYHSPVKNRIRVYGNEPGALSMPVYAYYDDDTGDCLYLCNTDVSGFYKINETVTAQGYLLHRIRQVTPDVFDSRHYRQPYEDVIGVLEGDWMTAAEAYRAFLAEHADWYKGPVGAATNPMPARVKDLAFVATHQWGLPGEYLKGYTREKFLQRVKNLGHWRDPWVTTEDAYGEDHRLVGDRVGGGVFSTWYAGHYEGSIRGESTERHCCLYSADHEAEAGALTRAVRTAQDGTDNIVAPYINGQTAYYYPANPEDRGPYNERNRGAAASALLMESGDPALMGRQPMSVLCSAAPWWREHLPEVVRDHYRRWGMRGAYIDYFMNFHTCYARDHDHKPGGGDYLIRSKIYQLRRMRELLAREGMADFAIAMESVCGPYTAETNLSYRHMFANWAAVKESEAIPYFEWVFDNIKYYRVTCHGAGSHAEITGLWSWYVANEVFLFGHLPSAGNGLTNYQEFFHHPAGEPYYAYLVKLARLRMTDDFKRFHNGTLVRVPRCEVEPEADFHVPVNFPVWDSGSPDGTCYDESSDGNLGYAKPYILTVLPHGMFKSPDGDLCFAITNPWVGPNPFSDAKSFRFRAKVDPAVYAGFPNRYLLTRVGPDGPGQVIGEQAGPVALEGELEPGEVVYWTLERL